MLNQAEVEFMQGIFAPRPCRPCKNEMKMFPDLCIAPVVQSARLTPTHAFKSLGVRSVSRRFRACW